MQNKISIFQITKYFVMEVFFPKRCVQCGAFGDFVCFDCAGKIERIKTPTCPECGRITEFGRYCPRCKDRTKTALTGLIIAAKFDRGPVKEMIHHLKYNGITDLAPLLGELLVERLRIRPPAGRKGTVPFGGQSPDIVVVPVPLHCKRQAGRGFNQAELLARYVCKRLDIPGGIALERTEDTKSQVELSGDERRTNLIGKFRVVDPELVEKKIVLLIDDVTTTGSTLNECAKALRTAGAGHVYGLVVARG